MKHIFIFILITVVALVSCKQGGEGNDALPNHEIKIFRYDRLQYEASALNSVSAQQRMSIDCPQATKILIEDVLGLGQADSPAIMDELCAYYADSTLVKLMYDAEDKFVDISPIEKKLTKAFRKLKQDLPTLPIPQVFSLFSALNQSVVVGDSLLGFSIDKYMGEDYPLYRKYYYAYQRRYMTPERILPDCISSYLTSCYPFEWETGHRTLFDFIMYRGKISWVTRKALSISTDEALMGYTPQQADWCKQNGRKFWKWMIEQDHLRRTDPMLIRAYTHPDPRLVFNGLPVPPSVGIWLGMKLVERYMYSHPNTTIQQLMECRDFPRIQFE